MRLVLVVLWLVAGFARGAEAPAFSEKEIAQGYRDGVVLAKPQPQFRARVDADEAGARIRVRSKFPGLGDLRVVEVGNDESPKAAIARLTATGFYEFVEPDFIYRSDATPNDPSYPAQWSLNNTGQLSGSTLGADIKAPSAWEIVHDAPTIVVAMIDGGVRTDHADLAPNLWVNPQPTFGDINGARIIRGVRSGDVTDERGHGSHTAGIVGAAANNGVGMAGVAWRVQLMILKNAGADGASATSDSAACLDYAVAHGAKIVNCSFGGTGFSQTFYTAIRAARDAGVIVVAAAGNEALNNDITAHYPSSYLLDNVVAVGNSGPTDAPSSSSDYGATVELFAPGTSILSIDFTTTTGVVSKSGTSMSAPHVTGALALLKAQFPADTYRQLINRLLRGTDIKTSLAGRAQTTGRLNLLRALSTSTSRPFNDDYATRALVTGSSFALRSNNRGATVEAGEPSHAGVAATGSLWWQWVAPASGTVVVETSGSDHDTTLAIYTGSSLANLTPVASNDNDGTKLTSRVSFNATALASYLIVTAGKNGAEGYTQLNIAVAAANDNFAGATVLTGESTQAAGRNSSASVETGEPQILGYPGGASLWYKWTAPRSGRFQISAFSLSFDTLLAVYTGMSLGDLTLVAANDDPSQSTPNSDALCTIEAVGGTTYYFQIDSKTQVAKGDVIVSVTDSRWQASLGEGVTSAPSIATDGTIYVGTIIPDRRLYALTPEGALKWTYAANASIDVSSPAIASDGTLFLGTLDGRITALTPAGVVRWQRDFGLSSHFVNTPALGLDGTVYAQCGDGYLYALNPSDGATKWRFYTNLLATFASPSVGPDGTIYQGSDTDQCVYAITPAGAQKWKYVTGGTTYSAPAVDASGNVYLVTYSNFRLISLRPDGTLRWTYTGATAAISGSPVLSADGGTVYFGASDRKVYAVDSATGAARWTYTTGNSILGCTPAVDGNGVVYIGAYDGKLYAINSNGSLKRTWDSAQPIRSSPAIFGTTLYVGSRDAKLYAFDIGATAAVGPWPQYAQNVRRVGHAVATPVIASQPVSQTVNEGASLTLTTAASGSPAFQWQRNGGELAGATGSALVVDGIQPANAGLYAAVVTGDGVTSSDAAIVGVTTTSKVIGSGVELQPVNIPHPNGNTFDQVLLNGTAETITADANQVTRTSFIDLNDDIVQVEFTGAGTLSLVLDNATDPAQPVNYNQAVNYMKGHAGIVVAGANETTNLSIFTVGRVTAFDPTGGFNFLQAISATNNPANNGSSLFVGHAATAYDGIADVAFIAISTTNGKFGGLRAAGASCFAAKGLTGIYAPDVQFTGPVFISDIVASGSATPVFIIGSSSDTRITGGDLAQVNGQPVKVAGLTQLKFTAGGTSNNAALPAQTNKAVLLRNGVDVTSQVVVNPSP